MLVKSRTQQDISVIRGLLLSTENFPGASLREEPGSQILGYSAPFFLVSAEVNRTTEHRSSSQNNIEIWDVDSTIVNFFADQIFEEFPQIVLVAYWREDEKITLWTVMPELDRSLRRQIYRVQEDTILRFPEYKFDCYVVSSVSAIPDSFTRIENPNR